MRKTAFIWRKSVYNNRFRCIFCGEMLARLDGTPLDTTLIDEQNNLLICPFCKNVVAKIKSVDIDERINNSGLMGNWEDFKESEVK